MGVLDTMAGATPTTRTETIILDAALAARWEELSKGLDAAATDDAKALTDGEGQTESLALPATTRVVNEMEQIRAEVEASEVTFTFEQMDWLERVDLQAEHPPRDGNVGDRMRGFNATYIPALIKATCVKVTDANGDEATDIPAATWDKLLGNPEADPPIRAALAPGQVSKLYAAAQAANQGETQVPPSARFLLGSQDSEASLAQPSPGQARPRSASKAGSRRTSRSTSTTTPEDSSGP